MDNAPRWSDVRVVEGARLEIWCGARPHLGFESLSLRRKNTKGFCPLVFFLLEFGWGFETERQAKPPVEGLQRRRRLPDYREAKANPYHSGRKNVTVQTVAFSFCGSDKQKYTQSRACLIFLPKTGLKYRNFSYTFTLFLVKVDTPVCGRILTSPNFPKKHHFDKKNSYQFMLFLENWDEGDLGNPELSASSLMHSCEVGMVIMRKRTGLKPFSLFLPVLEPLFQRQKQNDPACSYRNRNHNTSSNLCGNEVILNSLLKTL